MQNKGGIPIILSIAGILVALISGSRSFFIGYLISLLFIVLVYRNYKVSIRNVAISVFSLCFLVYSLVSFIKPDSSLGRKLVYKISFQILNDHYISGIGFGNFGQVYGEYQINYFAKGDFTIKELLLADNTKHAFNDYLQFIIEGGILGCLALILFVALIIYVIKIALRKYPKSILLVLSIAQLIVIAVAAIFMHVFEKPWIQLITVILLIFIIKYAYLNEKKQSFFYVLIVSTIFFICYYHYGFYVMNYKKFEKFEEAKQLGLMGFNTDSFSILESLYPTLKDDVGFLTEYASLLTLHGKHSEAEKIYLMVVRKNNSNIFYLNLAKSYLQSRKYRDAEQAYLKSINRAPNRFVPRFELYNFYKATQQFHKAKRQGNEILKLPVKIPSLVVDQIKKEVFTTINTLTIN
ncbi:tetratricopeptide (TPR) repeat protein [Pedobacter sp. AK017]|uniref:O-antigen ligase family protein n=1 Tax=Pedobacter sp. AK017 TaxID=2723073 RepID=UPI00160CC6B6|nr:O-antigen ligase family protein [Pedobacter sp. AK017]MBB5438180.1 tetratricopeptide (TPR) repeat protein [Pedobacter sp. AK017]